VLLNSSHFKIFPFQTKKRLTKGLFLVFPYFPYADQPRSNLPGAAVINGLLQKIFLYLTDHRAFGIGFTSLLESV
jgi:hypothetical protein